MLLNFLVVYWTRSISTFLGDVLVNLIILISTRVFSDLGMIRGLIIVCGILVFSHNSYAQRYDSLISLAQTSLAENKPKEAANHYSRAFSENGNRGTLDDRYDAARAWAKAGFPDSAFYQLFRIAERGNFTEHKRLTTEKDFIVLHSLTPWIQLIEVVLTNKQRQEANYIQPLASELEMLYDNDQRYRIMIDSVQRKHGWESEEVKALFKKMAKIDSINLLRVTNILDTYGWLGPDKVGHKGNSCLFLVIQHADLPTQKKYYPLIRDAALKGDVELSSLAMLEDRISVRENRKQKFGTQIIKDESTGNWVLAPLEDPTRVDEFRTQVGLEPLAEYLKHWGIKWP